MGFLDLMVYGTTDTRKMATIKYEYFIIIWEGTESIECVIVQKLSLKGQLLI